MTLDALRLEVPDILDGSETCSLTLVTQLARTRELSSEAALEALLGLLFRLNRSGMTLLERQRSLQNFSDEYRFQMTRIPGNQPPSRLFVRFCNELAIGFKRLLLQMLQGRQPSRQHLAWCLYMAQYFLSQSMLRQYQLYQEPAPGQWRDSHLLYWLGEHQDCLDETVSAAFLPQPASTLRGLYQQLLLLALSNPFHLNDNEAPLLYGALSCHAGLPRLLPWDADDEVPSLLVDLSTALPCQALEQMPASEPHYLRRFELGMLLVSLNEPAPLQSQAEQQLLERVRQHWLGRQQRRHERTEQLGECQMVIGLTGIHAQLLEQRPERCATRVLDGSPGGARLLCNPDLGVQVPVGQLLLLLPASGTPLLALIRWRHQNSQGLHLGLRYLKGLPRPVWLRRAPSAQTHAGILQSTPAHGGGWHHGLWLPQGHFVEGENLWLQLHNVNNQTILPLPAANLTSATVIRYPLRLA